MALFKLPANQPPARFYQGGRKIAAFRSLRSTPDHTPEDWVASTTCCYGHQTLGLSKLPSGAWLADEIQKDPVKWLGSRHVEKFGPDTKILVKLLDAGQRLPVHAHPHADWARVHVGAMHGKAEAWFTLTPGEVFLGLKAAATIPELLSLIEQQGTEALLSMMHRIPVEPFQTIYVPPGLLHAIGEGILLVEIQEPEDLSILLEWRNFEIDGAQHGHLGLGFEKALTGVERQSRTIEEIKSLVTPAGTVGSVIVPASEGYFRLQHFKVTDELVCSEGFAVIIVLEGVLDLRTALHNFMLLERGNTVVIGHGEGTFTLSGDGDIVIARPPSCDPV